MNKFTKLSLGLVLFAVLILPNVSDAAAPKYGSRGADVVKLQQELILKGFSIPAGATGYFGAQTQAAFSARAAFLAKGATQGASLTTSNIAPPSFPSAVDINNTAVATMRPTVSATDCAVGHKFSSKTGKSCLTQDQTSSSPTCTLTADKPSYKFGDTITFSWKSQNATYAWWQQLDTYGLIFPGDKLSADGSQKTDANVYGSPSATLMVGGVNNGTGSCTKVVNIVSPYANSSSCTKGDSYDTASGVRCTNVPKSAAVSTTTVTLITPNGGETFIKGNPYTIQWNSTTTPTVSLILRNQTTSIGHYIDPAVSGVSSYNWTVPTYISGGHYKVTVTDVDDSSSADSSDNSFFIAYTASDADVNNDGTVNGVDLGMVLGAWGPYNGQRAEDINEDGTVNQADVSILNSMWGPVL